MKYLTWHLVDAVTGEYTNDCMTVNGLTHPSISGLNAILSYNNVIYGTCDDSVTLVPTPAVILSQADMAVAAATVFASMQADKISQLNELAITKRDQLISANYHSSEISAGVVKQQQAVLALAAPDDASADLAAPQLKIEADVRGITTKELATRVQAQHVEFMNLEAQIAGYQGKLVDQIKAIVFAPADLFDNFSILNGIDIVVGWPV